MAGWSRTLTLEKVVLGTDEDELAEEALGYAERAIEIDPTDARGLRERGYSCLYLRRHDESLFSFEQAKAISHNDADLLADYADALAHAGYPGRAKEMCGRAIQLNPVHPDYYDWILGSVHYQMEEYTSAIRALDGVRHNPGAARLLAASHAMAGNVEEAGRYARIVREHYPRFGTQEVARFVPNRNSADTAHLIEGLRRAGLS